jgi:hypothetical protein
MLCTLIVGTSSPESNWWWLQTKKYLLLLTNLQQYTGSSSCKQRFGCLSDIRKCVCLYAFTHWRTVRQNWASKLSRSKPAMISALLKHCVCSKAISMAMVASFGCSSGFVLPNARGLKKMPISFWREKVQSKCFCCSQIHNYIWPTGNYDFVPTTRCHACYGRFQPCPCCLVNALSYFNNNQQPVFRSITPSSFRLPSGKKTIIEKRPHTLSSLQT